ncbi:MAG TPA: hypothetical protein RWO66_11335 [Ruminococcus sp.]|nr:MAG TPA: hypothetical protein [Caudoviricetes sp.]DAZ59395.1 MAG TPA: hypothetical protein [Caudoviricetes sp.]
MKSYIVRISNNYGEIRQVVVRARTAAAAIAEVAIERSEYIETCVEV